MKAITQTDAEELKLLRRILHAANIWKVEVEEAFCDCLDVIYWKSGKRKLARIRQKYAAMADDVKGCPCLAKRSREVKL